MTPDEFEKRMQCIKEEYDPEMAHILADNMMCEILSSLGYEKGVKIFNGMEIWYS